MGHTADVTVVLAHGAGSTGEAARALLGLHDRADVVTIEDRTGDVESVIADIDAAIETHPDCAEIIGVSLGAHAAARWASDRDEGPALTCVLPAWIGAAGRTALATADAARGIRESGIAVTLATMATATSHRDIAELLAMAWSNYTDEQLHTCLDNAARGRAPTDDELAAIRLPVTITGWYGDAFHPSSTACAWSRRVPGARIGLAARPSSTLLQSALRSLRWSA